MSTETVNDTTGAGNDWRTFLSEASFWTPAFLVDSAWTEHTPFAFWSVEAIRPRRIVELGTHNGQSYMAFCQAVTRMGLTASTFAVDTWQGDEHAGFYGNEVLDALREVHDVSYNEFSQLLQMTFAEAANVIEDSSVDLLHIDGRHFEEDVREDFEQWLPKVSDSGVVLFHDTQVRERGFGVYRLWAELEQKYPSFEFRHGHGLGVLAVGKNTPAPIARLTALQKDSHEAQMIRSAYSRLGVALSAQWDSRSALTREADERRKTQQAVEELRDALMADIEDLRGALKNRDDELAASQAELLDVKRQLKRRSTELQQLRVSTSWRVTKPMRALNRKSKSN